jgi:glycolate oxidase FAD binding subunit
VRDFLLGVQFIDGKGQIVRAGGKVVKNAAGFDIPKLMVGSLGSLGALTEVSFKVFPRPGAYATIKNTFSSLDQSLEKLIELTVTPIDLFCLDLASISDGFEMILRIGGLPECFPERYQRLQTLLGDGEIIEGESDINLWRQVCEFTWLPQNSALIKIPLTPKLVPSLDYYLAENGAVRRYTVGANLAWIGWSGEMDSLDRKLNELKLSGLILFGTFERTRIGIRTGDSFYHRVKTALDPNGLWLEV